MVKRDVESVLRSGVILVALAIFGAPPAQAQLDRSHCADCHFANPYTEPAHDLTP